MLRSAEGVVVDCAALSDPGRDPEKQTNEDSLAVAEMPFGIAAVVCDGMGGHDSGELASRAAVQCILETLGGPQRALDRLLSTAIEHAHAEVFALGGDAPIAVRPGSTAVLLALAGQEAMLAYVGDSRAYRVRARNAERLTTDHSVVEALLAAHAITPEAAKVHPDANRITRALGIAAEIEPDLLPPLRLEIGDAFLLCSDGLTDLVEDSELGELVAAAASPEAACQSLVSLANARGGHDNISVIVLRVLAVGAAIREHTQEMPSGPEQTVIDGPAFTVVMTAADSAPPTPATAERKQPARSTVPTLVDAMVAAQKGGTRAPATEVIDPAAVPAAAVHPPNPVSVVTQPSAAHTPILPPRREARVLFWAAAGISTVILLAIALWSALR